MIIPYFCSHPRFFIIIELTFTQLAGDLLVPRGCWPRVRVENGGGSSTGPDIWWKVSGCRWQKHRTKTTKMQDDSDELWDNSDEGTRDSREGGVIVSRSCSLWLLAPADLDLGRKDEGGNCSSSQELPNTDYIYIGGTGGMLRNKGKGITCRGGLRTQKLSGQHVMWPGEPPR